MKAATSQAMSYDEFVQQHGPKQKSPPRKTKSPAPIPQISTTTILTDLAPVSPGAAPAADPDFLAALVAQLQAAFATTGPWPENLSATVSFTLGAEGKLRSIAIATSSDHPAFDDAARSACRQAQVSAVPTSAAGQAYQITFSAVPRR